MNAVKYIYNALFSILSNGKFSTTLMVRRLSFQFHEYSDQQSTGVVDEADDVKLILEN